MATPPPDIAAKLAILRQQAAELVKQDAEYKQQADRQYTPVLQPNPNWTPKSNKSSGGGVSQDAMQLALMNGGGRMGQRTLPKERKAKNLAKFLESSAIKDLVYHGTGADVGSFRPSRIGALGPGIYVTSVPKEASEYAQVRKSINPNENPNVMPLHVQTQNPFHISSVNNSGPEFFKHFDPEGKLSDDEVMALAKQHGYDSVHAKLEGVTNIFDPRRLKSAIGNRGTYDVRKADVNKADGGSVPANKRMIEAVYNQYPVHPFNPNQRAMVEGEGEDQTLGTFELKPSMSARNAVELDWLSAYPHKQGVGSRTLKALQGHAAEHGVGLTLFPWEHGGVSQSKLIKFYKKHGFVPTTKGGKAMIWRPEEKSAGGPTHAHHLEIEERPL